MKRLHQLPGSLILLILYAFTFSSCSDQSDYDFSGSSDLFQNSPKTDGTVLSLLQGNVELIIPEGALASSVIFNAKQCENPNECRFLLKMVKIEPLVSFTKPVTVKLKCNGCLSNGYTLPIECTPVVKFWETEADILMGVESSCVSCSKEIDGTFLKFSIMQTGVFAIGNPGLTEPVE